MIDYEHFSQLDIRIGTITAVAVVPEADRLLRLMVDIGEAEPRQIVSGIREFFPDPDVLVGRQCPFLVNLEPRTIKGLESQGMILAAGAGDTFRLLHPHDAVPPGTPIS
jgi:methionyl-tRNA synthetase